jgi:hypothetical protein
MKLIMLFTLVTFSLFFNACSSKKEYANPQELIKASTKYLNEKNIDGFMTTILPRSPYYHDIETNTKKLFDLYDLNYKVEDIKILEQNESEIKVEFTQTTLKVKGPDFKNNKTTGVHVLQKDGNSWKVYSTQIVNVVFLDQKDFHN